MNKNIFAEQIPITYDFNSMFAEVLNGYSSNYIFPAPGPLLRTGILIEDQFDLRISRRSIFISHLPARTSPGRAPSRRSAFF